MRILLLIALSFLVLPACQDQSDSTSPKEAAPAPQPTGIMSSIAVEEFEMRLREDDIKMLVDVRTDAERERDGMIIMDGVEAQHWDFSGADFQERVDAIDPEVHIYVYCASGGRSTRAGRMLIEKGTREVYNLNGGITAWKAAGKAIVTP